jgi:hypothetical protein
MQRKSTNVLGRGNNMKKGEKEGENMKENEKK